MLMGLEFGMLFSLPCGVDWCGTGGTALAPWIRHALVPGCVLCVRCFVHVPALVRCCRGRHRVGIFRNLLQCKR